MDKPVEGGVVAERRSPGVVAQFDIHCGFADAFWGSLTGLGIVGAACPQNTC